MGRGSEIEKTARVWAAQRLERDLEHRRLPKRGPVVRIVDKQTLEEALNLPKLVSLDQREDSLRIKPIGSIKVPFWREVRVLEDETGQRSVPAAENYVQLTRGRERKVDLGDLPDRPVHRLLMPECSDIETAIRQAYHVKQRYLGEETAQLDLIWDQINGVWRTVLEHQVNQTNLQELASQTAGVLEEARLTSARKTAKINISKRLMGVFQKDSLARLNPLVQRIRLRSAFLDAVGLEAFSVLVRRKFTAVAGVLLLEREITRQALCNANEAVGTIMGFGKRGAFVFEGGNLQKGEAEGLEMALEGAVHLLARPKVAPYLPVARAAGIALWGCRPKYVEANRQIIGEETAKVIFDSEFICARDLIRQERFNEAKALTQTWVNKPIVNVLDQSVIGIDVYD